MFKLIRSRLAGDKDRGFTLIELMIVVLIIAILIAIAIPTFLGARTKSQERAAQVVLRQGLLTAKSFYTDTQSYAATAAQLAALEPTISFDATIANASATVVGFTGTATTVVMEKQAVSGNWFCIADSTATGTTYGSGAAKTDVDTVGECIASSW